MPGKPRPQSNAISIEQVRRENWGDEACGENPTSQKPSTAGGVSPTWNRTNIAAAITAKIEHAG
jgi:hypothetical protein